MLLRYGQTMEQTATRAFKEGIIDRRNYLLLTKGFTGDDAENSHKRSEPTIDDF